MKTEEDTTAVEKLKGVATTGMAEYSTHDHIHMLVEAWGEVKMIIVVYSVPWLARVSAQDGRLGVRTRCIRKTG